MQSLKLRVLDGQPVELFSTDNQNQGSIKMNGANLELKGVSGISIQSGNDLYFQGSNATIKGNGSTILKFGVSGDTVSLRETGVTYQLPSINTLSDVDISGVQTGNVLRFDGTNFVPYDINTDYYSKQDLNSTSGQSYIGVTPISGIGTNTTVQEALEKLKLYQDSLVQGLDFKDSVRVATTTNESDIDLTTPPTVIDDVTIQEGDRVLVKNQVTNKAENGIYVFTGGQLVRQQDQDSDNEVTPGMYVFVEEGTINGGTSWVLSTTGPITLGTTELTFTLFDKQGEYTGSNLGTGVGVFKNREGNILYFKSLSSSSKISITDVSDTLTFDIVESQLNLNNISGVLNVTKGGTGLSNISGNRLLWTSAQNTFTEIGLDVDTLEVSGGNLRVVINDSGTGTRDLWSASKISTELSQIQSTLASHNHDDRYYTETELQTAGSQQVSFGNITNYSIQREVVTLSTPIAQDSAYTLPNGLTYTPGANNLVIYVDGIKRIQDKGATTYDYAETSSTTVTFHFDIPQGSIIEIYKYPVPSEI